jgi:cellobiose phosphorylase
MINPISHGATPADIATYRVEPYVVAADVYGVRPHTGRGGWTWYTGSAGWMYRLIVESLIGLHLEVDKLRISPCLPADWTEFQIHYRYRQTFYHITIHNGGTGAFDYRLTLDGIELTSDFVPLVDDGREHNVKVETQVSVVAPASR